MGVRRRRIAAAMCSRRGLRAGSPKAMMRERFDSDDSTEAPAVSHLYSTSSSSEESVAPCLTSPSNVNRRLTEASGDSTSAASRLRVAVLAVIMTVKVRAYLRRSSRCLGASAGVADEADSGLDDEPGVRALMRLLEPGGPLANTSDFAKEYGDAAFCRRLLRKYDGNVTKAMEKYQGAILWREQNQDLLTMKGFKPTGDLRVIGFDRESRPLLYQCGVNQDSQELVNFDQFVVRAQQAIEIMPAGVQKMSFICDAHGVKMRALMNPAAFLQMIQSVECYFAERFSQIIVVDMPRMGMMVKDAVWPMCQESTRRKVLFLTAAELRSRLHEFCEADVADRLTAIMDENRSTSRTLEERRRSWQMVDKHGALIPACPHRQRSRGGPRGSL